MSLTDKSNKKGLIRANLIVLLATQNIVRVLCLCKGWVEP